MRGLVSIGRLCFLQKHCVSLGRGFVSTMKFVARTPNLLVVFLAVLRELSDAMHFRNNQIGRRNPRSEPLSNLRSRTV